MPGSASKAPGDQLVKLCDSYKFLFNHSKISYQIIVLSVNFIIILTFFWKWYLTVPAGRVDRFISFIQWIFPQFDISMNLRRLNTENFGKYIILIFKSNKTKSLIGPIGSFQNSSIHFIILSFINLYIHCVNSFIWIKKSLSC